MKPLVLRRAMLAFAKSKLRDLGATAYVTTTKAQSGIPRRKKTTGNGGGLGVNKSQCLGRAMRLLETIETEPEVSAQAKPRV